MSKAFASLAEPASSALHGELSMPLFGLLVERMHAGGRWEIVDLGAAQAATIELFSRLRCRLDIIDLQTRIDALNAHQEPEDREKLIEAVFPASRKNTVDVVLCWDLLNYLERPALAALMKHIATRARAGAMIHALIEYSFSRMPAQPGHYFPCGGDRMMHVPVTREERAAPRYTPKDLARCLPDFQVERALLLGSGMQEYLFRLRMPSSPD